MPERVLVAGSINNMDAHPRYALFKALMVAETILKDDTATDNERALADCIIAICRNIPNPSYD